MVRSVELTSESSRLPDLAADNMLRRTQSLVSYVLDNPLLVSSSMLRTVSRMPTDAKGMRGLCADIVNVQAGRAEAPKLTGGMWHACSTSKA